MADPSNGTLIVLQWLDPSPPNPTRQVSLWEFYWDTFGPRGRIAREYTLARRSNGLYFVDGNDIGSGTFNIYLLAEDPDAAVARVIEIYEDGHLAPGMRIAVAEYTNPERSDWNYRPVYPADLDEFGIFDR